MARCQVDLHVAGSGRNRLCVAAGNHRAGKATLGPVKVVLVAGLAAGQSDRFGPALATAGEDLHSLRHANVHLGGEAAGQCTGQRACYWKPARLVEQIGNRFLNGSQLDSVNRAFLVAGYVALVLEGPARELAFCKGRSRSYADAAVRRTFAREQIASLVGDSGHL